MATDSLLLDTPQDIIAKTQAGLIPVWKSVLHDELLAFIDAARAEDIHFLEKPLQYQKSLLEKMAKEMVG